MNSEERKNFSTLITSLDERLSVLMSEFQNLKTQVTLSNALETEELNTMQIRMSEILGEILAIYGKSKNLNNLMNTK